MKCSSSGSRADLLVLVAHQRLDGGVAHALVHVGQIRHHQRRHAVVLDGRQVVEQLDLLGRVALVARLVALQDRLQDLQLLLLAAPRGRAAAAARRSSRPRAGTS